MANKALFSNVTVGFATDTVNKAGGVAYSMESTEALAQYAVTGCLNGTFYASEGEQLEMVKEHASNCSPGFIAKLALYAREKAFMKDMPALLAATLAARGELGYLGKIFDRVLDNGKMIRNFCQMIRSGQLGRKSFGTSIKKMLQDWIARRDGKQLFFDSVGNDPSLADVIKMVHPKPKDDSRANLYAYLIGKEFKSKKLPKIVQDFESYKKDKSGEVPAVPFQMLTALDLGTEEWTAIAKTAGWQMTRMNLNTFARHKVLDDKKMVDLIANRLRDVEEIKKARVFPYQIMMAFKAGEDLPRQITDALQDAMEIAVSNVPEFEGKVFVFPDVSGSMSSAITGNRKGSTSAIRCIDTAALIAAAIMRKAKDATVIPFEQDVVSLKINSRDSVMTIAAQIGGVGGGGTNCSAPLRLLNAKKETGDLIVYVSDNESWVDSTGYGWGARTGMMKEWLEFKKRSPKAKMVCIDLQPSGTVQVSNSPDIMNIGGFSDVVFDIIARFLKERNTSWVKVIEEIEL